MAPRLMEAYVRSLNGEWPAVDSIVRGVESQRGRLTPTETAIVDGLRANLRGDRPARVRAARDLARLTPGSVEGYTLLAEMALNVDDPQAALEALAHVDPDRGFLLFSAVYWQTRARAQHERREYREELETARRGVRRFPDDVGPQVALTRALAALGRVDEVRQTVDRYRAREPTGLTDANYLLLASAAELRTHGQAVAAERLLASALPAGAPPPPDTVSMESERIGADLYYEAGRWADARLAVRGSLCAAPGRHRVAHRRRPHVGPSRRSAGGQPRRGAARRLGAAVRPGTDVVRAGADLRRPGRLGERGRAAAALVPRGLSDHLHLGAPRAQRAGVRRVVALRPVPRADGRAVGRPLRLPPALRVTPPTPSNRARTMGGTPPR